MKGWSTFFDPLTKHHIIKTGRLPGKKLTKCKQKRRRKRKR